MKKESIIRCTRCIMDNSSDETIVFDENGVCNYCKEAMARKEKEYFPNEEGQEITIDNELINGSKSRNLSNYLGNFIIDNWNEYKASFGFNGNPIIELGDCIEVENKYSTEEEPIFNKIWVTKIESEYNGSFNQAIEGDVIE